MTTYGDIRTKFLARVRRRDCTTALADGFISDSIKRVQRVMRVPTGERSISVALDNSTYFTAGGFALPSDYIKMREVQLTSGDGIKRTLKRRPLSEVVEQVARGADGTTWCYARQGGLIVLGPTPLAGDTLRLDFWSEFEEADDDADETVLFNIAEDLIVYGALSYACDHFEDKRLDRFERRFQQILGDIQEQADSDELANAQVAPGFSYPDDGF